MTLNSKLYDVEEY